MTYVYPHCASSPGVKRHGGWTTDIPFEFKVNRSKCNLVAHDHNYSVFWSGCCFVAIWIACRRRICIEFAAFSNPPAEFDGIQPTTRPPRRPPAIPQCCRTECDPGPESGPADYQTRWIDRSRSWICRRLIIFLHDVTTR